MWSGSAESSNKNWMRRPCWLWLKSQKGGAGAVATCFAKTCGWGRCWSALVRGGAVLLDQRFFCPVGLERVEKVSSQSATVNRVAWLNCFHDHTLTDYIYIASNFPFYPLPKSQINFQTRMLTWEFKYLSISSHLTSDDGDTGTLFTHSVAVVL